MKDEWLGVMVRELDLTLTQSQQEAWKEFTDQNPILFNKVFAAFLNYARRKTRRQGLFSLTMQAVWMYCIMSLIVPALIPVYGAFIALVCAACATAFVGFVFEHTGNLLSLKLINHLLSKAEANMKNLDKLIEDQSTEESETEE